MIGVTSIALLTVTTLFDRGAGPNLINKDFLPSAWKESDKSIKSPQWQAASGKVVNIEVIVPLSIRIGDLHVRASRRIVENPAVDVLLEALFIDQCIHRIFTTERKIVPWQLRPVATIWTRMATNMIRAYDTVFNVNTSSHDEALRDEFNLCCVARLITVPAYTQAAVLVSCQSAGLMTIETDHDVVECRCSITARGLMYILTGKQFYTYIANLTARPGNLQRFVIVDSASNAATCIIHARDDETHILKDEGAITTQCDKFNTDPIANSICYTPSEGRDEQMD